jgi:Protein of unknown function (DUF3303)
MTVSLPTDAANDRIRSGSFGSTMSAILAEMKAEAVYFTASPGGERSGLFIIDLKDASEIVKYAEPWFLAFGAAVNFEPVMTPSDLEKAGPHFEAALKY